MGGNPGRFTNRKVIAILFFLVPMAPGAGGCGYQNKLVPKMKIDTLVLIIVLRFSFIEICGECGYLEPSKPGGSQEINH